MSVVALIGMQSTFQVKNRTVWFGRQELNLQRVAFDRIGVERKPITEGCLAPLGIAEVDRQARARYEHDCRARPTGVVPGFNSSSELLSDGIHSTHGNRVPWVVCNVEVERAELRECRQTDRPEIRYRSRQPSVSAPVTREDSTPR
jgi:hypothetical protein